MTYNLYFYDNAADAELNFKNNLGKGVFVEKLNFDSNSAALLYAAETIQELNKDNVLEDDSEQAITTYLDSIDMVDGNVFCIAITCGDDFIYGDQDLLEDFCTECTNETDKITEAIVNNPKLDQLADLKVELKELEKEIEQIKYDTSRMGKYEINDKALAFLSPEEQTKYHELLDEYHNIEKEIATLEAQYQSIEWEWRGTADDDGNYEEVINVIDDKLEAELEPKVKELQAKLLKLYQERQPYEDKARAAYNADASDRRLKAGLKDKSAYLDTLKKSKEELLKEISEDPSFKDVIEDVKMYYKTMKIKDAGIINNQLWLEVEVNFDMEVDSEYFNYDNYFSEDKACEDVKDSIESILDIDISPYWTFEDSEEKFFFQLVDYWIEGDPVITRDGDIEGDLTGFGTIKITKLS